MNVSAPNPLARRKPYRFKRGSLLEFRSPALVAIGIALALLALPVRAASGDDHPVKVYTSDAPPAAVGNSRSCWPA